MKTHRNRTAGASFLVWARGSLPALALGATLLAAAPSAWAEQVVIGPFVQQVSRTSALVVWETDEAAPSEVAYGSSPNSLQSIKLDNKVKHHVVKLDGLEPATQYTYKVKPAGQTAVGGTFWTEVDRASSYRLAVYGDTRSRFDAHKAVVDAMAKQKPLAYFNTGDLVRSGSSESDWLNFFKAERAMLSIAPFYPTLGNHEGSGSRYLELFELPENSPKPERYYSVRYATASFVVVDMFGSSYDKGSTQYNWIEKTLKEADESPDILHSFVLIHSGPYDSGPHGSNMKARDALVPLFEKYHVEIVFSGHDHDYERGTVNGVKYVVTGGGGAPVYTPDGDSWTEVKAGKTHYCLLDFKGPRVTLTAIEPNGHQIDKFTLGDDVNECQSDSDCTGKEGTCSVGKGAWACVEGGCVWNCVSGSAPPDQDGGTAPSDGGQGEQDAGSVAQDAGGNGDAAVPQQDGGGNGDEDSGTSTPPAADGGEDDGSCSCSVPGGNGGSGIPVGLMFAAAALGLAAARRRR